MKATSIFAAVLALSAVTSALPVEKKTEQSTEVWDRLRGQIKHVVYLMMENHSFDNIAGYWDYRNDIDNLVGMEYCNNYTNPYYTIYNQSLEICASPYEQEVPLNDPDHDFLGTNWEIYQNYHPSNDDVRTMGGFVERESTRYNSTPGDSAFVIKAFSQKHTNILATIGQNYAVFDSYFAEHPGPTNPNRQFATSGSACGFVDDTTQAAGFFNNVTGTSCAKSIFQALSEKGISWKNYIEKDISDAFLYEWVQENAMDQIVHADQFYKDIEEGTLPEFSYYNPECCVVSSMHPTSNLAAGEQLIKHLYDSIRNSQYWENTVIFLMFDEHGGFADHVPPPVNIPAPEDGIKFDGASEGVNVTYDFTRLGIRVPAFLISPLIPKNTLIHDQGTMYADNSEYTHTSYLHFLQNLWNLEGLNNRIQWAKTFENVFADKARSEEDCLKNLPTPRWYGNSGSVQPAPFYELNQPAPYYGD
ncbi:hypothetical protein Unana1_05047 [Umbelopsis nana]